LLVRFIFVILALAGGGGVLIYLILWIVSPEKPFDSNENLNQTPMENHKTEQQEPIPPSPPMPPTPPRNRHKGSIMGGMILITIGVLFLIDEFIPQINFGDLWPVILIVIGIGLLINTVTGRNQNN